MAITTESYNADGINKIYTVAPTILSQSHCRVDFYYDDGSGTATDHNIASNVWDVINNSIVFNDAPTDGYVVKVTVSTDGEGLETAPSAVSDVAASIENVNIVAGSIDNVNTTSNNIGYVEIVGTNLANGYEYVEDNGGILDPVTAGYGVSTISTVGNNIDKVSIVANDTVAINEIYDNRLEIYAADENATIATTQAGLASTSATASSDSATASASSASNASTSASNASTSASNASTSASNASNSATSSASSASSASTSETNAGVFEDAALAHKVATEAIYNLISTEYHSGEYVSNDNTTAEDFGTVVIVAHFAIEDGVGERTDFAVSSGTIDCGSVA